MFNNEEDLILVEEILIGKIRSFEILVSKYELTILKFIYSMLRDKETAEDVTQEVFITVYNKLDTFDTKYKFYNWIMRIAKNKAIDYVRKTSKVNEHSIDEVFNLSSKESSPEEIVEYKETKEKIQEYINGLESIDRQIIIMRYLNNITFNDISTILSISESSVKRRYYKIKEQFKKHIAVERGCEYEL
ncbi:ECF RNA polymerase sigma factor SigW [Clostridium homopropionicum DSM 5847]|uniref:ECF RNA polymerase sigma factor SigW n=1 Tax=Clostridium homopropionicum DSM 5847 TaxID=1121318 RepID=A0A0L6ZA58_9CLOT|nr:sigma-70 family RNA polymerase sigma factor [Clostridium homopropionicum]KOA19859.1 ECF RNA polymerase sigma factor SigW [Clostridium homopropionicum DSM 5847]SFF75896.1 RNA polymerase sigma-70 factor, ECF subfamily [Clostridium homopropionicum]